MRNIAFFILLSFVLSLCGCSNSQSSSAADASSLPPHAAEVLSAYVSCYPEAQLLDVYKFCFQDIYGPGHIIKDSSSCAGYITSEMESMGDSSAMPLYEYLGVDNNFVRVDLRVLRDGKVELGRFVSLLMLSADMPNPMPLDQWIVRWRQMVEIMRAQSPLPNNFESDSAEIEALFQRGEYVYHHSRRFNQAYNPHYRLIRRDLFESEILPLL